MYVGQTTRQNLRKRFAQYLEEQAGTKKSPRPKVQYILRKYADNIYFICMPLDAQLDPTTVENELLKAMKPPMNDRFPAEVSRVYRGILP
jgi:excinuclease UvrABC nuclease subunit